MRRDIVLVATAAVVIVVAILVLSPALGASPDAGASPTPLPPVPRSAAIVAEGRAIPTRTAMLDAAVPGTVTQVSGLGDHVSAGDALLRLDPRAAQANLNAAQASLEAATARSDQAKSLLDEADAGVTIANAGVTQASATVDKATAVRDQLPSGATSAQKKAADADVQAAQAALAGARAQVTSAEGARSAAQHAADAAAAEKTAAATAVTTASLALAELTLTAPFGGTVEYVGASVGEHVAPGLPVIRLADTSSWTFQTTNLSESSVGRVSVGDAATVTFSGLPGVSIAGHVAQIGGYGQEVQGDIIYTVVVDPDVAVPASVLWNMTASISITPSGAAANP